MTEASKEQIAALEDQFRGEDSTPDHTDWGWPMSSTELGELSASRSDAAARDGRGLHYLP
jgi:hypothetical protein